MFFLSPAPFDYLEAKTRPKKSTTNVRRIIDHDDDVSVLDDRAEPEPPKKSSQTRTLPVTTTTSTSRQNRSATQPTSAVDYDSIPEPFTKRKALGQSTSVKLPAVAVTPAPPARFSSRAQVNKVDFISKCIRYRQVYRKGKQAAALSTIADDENDDMEEQDGNGDSNMSMASVVDRNQAAESHAGRFNQEDDDDDSGNEDFGYKGDDNDGGMDAEEPEQGPIPESPRSKANDKARRNRVKTRRTRRFRNSRSEGRMMMHRLPMKMNNSTSGQEEEPEEPEPEESPRSKRARLAREKKEIEKEKAKQKREPSRQKDPDAQPKKTKRNCEPHSDTLLFNGGEESTLSSVAHELSEAPVPIISEIMRIPEAQPEPLSKKNRRQGTTKPPSSRNERNTSKQAEVWVESPDEGWDTETGQSVVVIYDTKQEMEKVIAQMAAMLNPKQPLNATDAFQRDFSDGKFVAGCVLEIHVGGEKPSKPARDNTYLFYCAEGAVRVIVHRSTFVIARNGMSMVPELENISDRGCKLLFAQARKVTEKMISLPTKRASMVPAGRNASASQTPRPVARVGPPAGSRSPSNPKEAGTSSKR
ncbi:hypothetical protein FRC05_004959 [Tulasnella sp. 425]|nr:hypothetical protein FRC05_004959 [Tulasnella sp. 425]